MIELTHPLSLQKDDNLAKLLYYETGANVEAGELAGGMAWQVTATSSILIQSAPLIPTEAEP